MCQLNRTITCSLRTFVCKTCCLVILECIGKYIWIPSAPFQNKANLNQCTHSVLFWGHKQTAVIRVSTVCLKNKKVNNMKNTTQQPLKRKWTDLIQYIRDGHSIWLKWDKRIPVKVFMQSLCVIRRILLIDKSAKYNNSL